MSQNLIALPEAAEQASPQALRWRSSPKTPHYLGLGVSLSSSPRMDMITEARYTRSRLAAPTWWRMPRAPNGKGFAAHAALTAKLGLDVCFAQP